MPFSLRSASLLVAGLMGVTGVITAAAASGRMRASRPAANPTSIFSKIFAASAGFMLS